MWIPWTYLIVTIMIGILTIQFNPRDALISLGLMLVSLPLYVIGLRLERTSSTLRRLLCESILLFALLVCFPASRLRLIDVSLLSNSVLEFPC